MTATESDGRQRLSGTFDRIASTYRNARPAYPAQVFALLASRCGLGVGTAVLEVGAGTGQATIPMLELGADVTAIEPGSALARELLARAPSSSLRVINTTFEDAPVQEAAFDIVASATAFHWVDPHIRLVKSAYALRDRGWLAVWSNLFGDPGRPDPFHEALQPLLRMRAPELLPGESVGPFQRSEVPGQEGDDEFDDVEEHIFEWEGRHNPQQVRALFSTFSSWIALPVERREPLLDEVEALARQEFGELVVRPYRTIVQLRRRKAR